MISAAGLRVAYMLKERPDQTDKCTHYINL